MQQMGIIYSSLPAYLTHRQYKSSSPWGKWRFVCLKFWKCLIHQKNNSVWVATQPELSHRLGLTLSEIGPWQSVENYDLFTRPFPPSEGDLEEGSSVVLWVDIHARTGQMTVKILFLPQNSSTSKTGLRNTTWAQGTSWEKWVWILICPDLGNTVRQNGLRNTTWAQVISWKK